MSRQITISSALALVALIACQRFQTTDGLLAEARNYRARDDGQAAMIQVRNALMQKPDQAAARQLLGELNLEQGDPLAAEKELRRAQQLGSPRLEVLPWLGKALLQLGEFSKLEEEVRHDPPSALVLGLRAYAELGLNDQRKAETLFQQALEKDPDLADAHLGLARVALARGDVAGALREADNAIAAAPAVLEARRFKGDLQRVQGKLDEARQSYQAILGLRPNNVQALVDLAGLSLQAGQAGAARAQVAAAHKLQPNSLAVMYAQALVDYTEGKHKSALDRLQQILRAAPDHMPSVLLAGTVELALRAPSQAEGYFKHFLKANPGHPYATRQLAAAALANGNPVQALSLLQPLVHGEKADAESYALAGEAAMQARQYGAAAEWFERANAMQANWRTGQALSLLGNGETGRAIEALQQATRAEGASSRAGVLLVMGYLRNKETDKALQQVAVMDPDGRNPLVQNLKGGVLLASGNLAAARVSFARALELDAQHFPALQNLVQLDLMEKKPDLARQRLSGALARDQRNPKILTALARLAQGQGRELEALGWLERAHRENPDAMEPARLLAAAYVANGQPGKALSMAQKLQAASPDNAELLALLADAEAANGQHAQALETLSRLALVQPNSAPVQMAMASANLALSRVDAALVAVRKALQYSPDRADAAALATSLLIEKQLPHEALRLARGWQERQPGSAVGFKLEGDVLMAQGKPAEAVQRYAQALALQPGGPVMIALHRALGASGKAALATQRMRQWLDKNPGDQPTRLYFASALLEDKDYKAAISQYATILQRDPANVIALNDQAWAYLHTGDARALAVAERAHEVAPANPAVADTLAWILVERGNTARALPLLKDAVGKAPATPTIRLHYAKALLKAGDKASARMQCEQLLAAREFPQRAEVQAILEKL